MFCRNSRFVKNYAKSAKSFRRKSIDSFNPFSNSANYLSAVVSNRSRIPRSTKKFHRESRLPIRLSSLIQLRAKCWRRRRRRGGTKFYRLQKFHKVILICCWSQLAEKFIIQKYDKGFNCVSHNSVPRRKRQRRFEQKLRGGMSERKVSRVRF